MSRTDAVPHTRSVSRPAHPVRRTLVPLAAAALGLSLVQAPAAAEAGEAAFEHYVALGDSFTAGPLIPPNAPGSDPRCLRSGVNYPRLVADALGVAEFTDASCSGAVIADLSEPQHEGLTDVPPQYDALTPETDLVSVGISGNDLGFSEIFVRCAKLSLTNPFGSPCADDYGDTLDDRVEELRGDVAQVYAEVGERSPDATVLAVGYLQILPESGGCWPTMPVARGDVAYLDALQTSLNTMIAEEAAAAGAVYVDVLERGHDVCEPAGDRWVEGVVPENTAFPVHPNEAGMAVTADRVLDELGVAPADV
ncbi:SGNH/GDSL hydrolase family protein [Nocardiopsis sp. NRRL B-16309]|uniref:SGNH/GDSL hydrolase family protein n=1 Tax=Nocardiopsis sp. NRRL B-16309 TaxID=1519494 RepID=UPI0006AE313E|nr:SGNH/GDSL hydrolase family protein [Nocardiopsis sp. NRRL B-16309]